MQNKPRLWVYIPIIAALSAIFGLIIGKKIYEGKGFSKPGFTFSKPGTSKKLQEMLDAIDDHYVDSIQWSYIEQDAIDAILKHLDPHTSYIPPQQTQIEQDRIEGNFGGIGIKFRIVQDTIMVLEVIENGPSQKAGILPGDQIISVNKDTFAGIGLDNMMVINTLRGELGTKVELNILRKNEVVSKTIRRGEIPLNSVEGGNLINDEIGYLKITRFSKKTVEEFKSKTAEWKGIDIKGIIIDLRGNPGGLLDEVITFCDEFLAEGKIIVMTKDKYGMDKNFASAKGDFEDMPVVVLVDENSASASEIFAGAIQDNDRGTIIGRRTFGKGLVQRPFDFKDGSVMRLTIARYYTPVGRCIQRPYIPEEKEDYYNKISLRLENGELFSADSINFPDSLRYTTKAGKTVYGGGGIMPDLFVPIDTSSIDLLLADIYSNALFERFVIEQKQWEFKDTMEEAYLELKAANTLEAFKTYTSEKLDSTIEWSKHKASFLKLLENELLSEILGVHFGEKGRYYPELLEDRAVSTAMTSIFNVGTPPSKSR